MGIAGRCGAQRPELRPRSLSQSRPASPRSFLRRHDMNRLLVLALALAAGTTSPLAAGDLHGRVTCKGVRNSGDAVVYVAAIAGKTFPAPSEHAKIDQANLVFAPHVLPRSEE